MITFNIPEKLIKSEQHPKSDKKYTLVLEQSAQKNHKGEDGKPPVYKVDIIAKDGPNSKQHRMAKALQIGQWVLLSEVGVDCWEWDGAYYTNLITFKSPLRIMPADGVIEHTQAQPPPPPKPMPPQNGPGANVMNDDEVPF